MRALFLALPLAAAAAAAPPLTPGDHRVELAHGDLARTYTLHVPPGAAPGEPLPLVLGLHGGGGSSESFRRKTGFSELADEAGFLVAYPDGTNRFFATKLLTWNAGHCCGYARRHGVDDVGFLAAVIADVARRVPVDPRRVFMTGHSNGAMMTHRFASERPDLVAAIAPVAGAIGGESSGMFRTTRWVAPRPGRPVAALLIHGLRDEHVRWEGGVSAGVDRGRVDLPGDRALRHWADAGGCAPTPRRRDTHGGEIEQVDFGGCADGVAVRAVLIRGTGHGWPGDTTPRRWNRDPTTLVSATALAWEFFAAPGR